MSETVPQTRLTPTARPWRFRFVALIVTAAVPDPRAGIA